MIIFSERKELERAVRAWLKEKAIAINVFNTISALNSLGRLIPKKAQITFIPCYITFDGVWNGGLPCDTEEEAREYFTERDQHVVHPDQRRWIQKKIAIIENLEV